MSLELNDQRDQRIAIPQSLNGDNLRRSSRPYVIAQWLVAGLAAAAGLVLLGQSLSRQIRGGATEFRTLGHLGLTRRDLSMVGAAHALSVVLPAALMATIGSYLMTPTAPLGVARVVEPHPGWHFDPATTTAGGALMVASLLSAAVPAVLSTARQRRQAVTPRPGRAGALARRMGAGPVSTTGLRMAFEPLRGPAAPPLRTGFGVILAAAVMLVAATVFGGSLDHLLASEHLIGWNWDAFVGSDDESREGSERLEEVARATPGVAQATSGTFFSFVQLGSERDEVLALSFSGGPIGPTMVSGRAPRGAHEIVLGRETLSRLGRRVGDQVPFTVLTGDDQEIDGGRGTEVHGEATIVGIAVLPSSGGDDRLGTGSAVAFEFFSAADPDRHPDTVFLRLEPDAEIDQVLASIADTLDVDEVDAITEEFLGSQFLDIGQVVNLPIVVAALLALLAVGVVAQVIVGSTQARRGELGVLRALGFRPLQIRAAIVVQALALSGSVLVVGLPLGIALGRGAWHTFALSLGTKPEVSVAIAWLAMLAAGLLLLASLIGLIGSARPRRQLATVLRRE